MSNVPKFRGGMAGFLAAASLAAVTATINFTAASAHAVAYDVNQQATSIGQVNTPPSPPVDFLNFIPFAYFALPDGTESGGTDAFETAFTSDSSGPRSAIISLTKSPLPYDLVYFVVESNDGFYEVFDISNLNSPSPGVTYDSISFAAAVTRSTSAGTIAGVYLYGDAIAPGPTIPDAGSTLALAGLGLAMVQIARRRHTGDR